MLAMNARSAFTKNDLMSAATIACTNGVFTQLGNYKVLAGEVLSVGYGDQSGQENAQGRIYIQLMDNTAAPGVQLHGIVRISVLGPQNSVMREVAQFRTEALSASTDRTKQIPLPDTFLGVSQDRKIILEFNPDSANVTVSKANSTVLIDTTRSVLA